MAEGSKAQEPQSWWQTTQGVLTALGALISAVAALIMALHQIGIFKKPSVDSGASIAPTSTQLARGSVATPGSRGNITFTPSNRIGQATPMPSKVLYEADWSSGLVGWSGGISGWNVVDDMLVSDGTNGNPAKSILAPYKPGV